MYAYSALVTAGCESIEQLPHYFVFSQVQKTSWRWHRIRAKRITIGNHFEKCQLKKLGF